MTGREIPSELPMIPVAEQTAREFETSGFPRRACAGQPLWGHNDGTFADCGITHALNRSSSPDSRRPAERRAGADVRCP
jgi:hypothetical protein